MSRHHNLTKADHRRLGRLLSSGVPFHRALTQVQNRPQRRKQSSANNRNPFHLTASSSDLSPVQTLIALLEIFSGFATLLGVLNIYSAYGLGLRGTFVVFLYLAGWEIIGRIFDRTRRKTPTPLRFLWDIIEPLFEVVA
jgi:hypothetical protein